METGPWGLNSKTSKNLSLVATLRNLNFKILSMQDTKLAQMNPGAKNQNKKMPRNGQRILLVEGSNKLL
jgi:hypothetical protein